MAFAKSNTPFPRRPLALFPRLPYNSGQGAALWTDWTAWPTPNI